MRRALVLAAALAIAACASPPLPSPVELLPRAEQVAGVLGNPMEADQEPTAGLPDALPALFADHDHDPAECVGVLNPAAPSAYAGLPVRAAAIESVVGNGTSGTGSTGATIAVLEFDSDAAAEAALATFIEQWKTCSANDVRSRLTPRGLTLAQTYRVRDVVDRDGVLTAHVLHCNGMNPLYFPSSRAVLQRSRYLVDVSVADSGSLSEPNDEVVSPERSEQFAGSDTAARELAESVAAEIPG